ncbi:MAG: hypothetical protein AAGB22_13330 [Bacteroidota bacterium]
MRHVTLSLLCCLLLAAPVTAQRSATQNTYNGFLLELKNAMGPKFQKSKWWKSRSAPWDMAVKRAKKVEVLTKMAIELENNLGKKATTEAWAKESSAWNTNMGKAAKFQDVGSLLLSLEANILPEMLGEAWASRQAEWRKEIEAANAKLLAEERKQAERVSLDPVMTKATLSSVYTDARKKFAGIKSGDGQADGDHQVFAASKKLPGSEKAMVRKDKEGTHDYVAVFPSLEFLDNAKDLAKQLSEAALGAAEDGFGIKENQLDNSYLGKKKTTIEFESDIIGEIGKRPSMEVGIRKVDGRYQVVFMMHQPLWI